MAEFLQVNGEGRRGVDRSEAVPCRRNKHSRDLVHHRVPSSPTEPRSNSRSGRNSKLVSGDGEMITKLQMAIAAFITALVLNGIIPDLPENAQKDCETIQDCLPSEVTK